MIIGKVKLAATVLQSKAPQPKSILFEAGQATPPRIAIQKSSRLFDESIKYLNSQGMKFSKKPGRDLVIECPNTGAVVLLARGQDVGMLAAIDQANFGIVGENQFEEFEPGMQIIERLGFAKCRMAIAVSKTSGIDSIDQLDGKVIATSHPRGLQKFLKVNSVDAKVVSVAGSVELLARTGVADAIYDLVETGSTLRANGLVELVTTSESEAVLVAKV